METTFRKKEQPRLIIYSVLDASLVLTASIVSLFGLGSRSVGLSWLLVELTWSIPRVDGHNSTMNGVSFGTIPRD